MKKWNPENFKGEYPSAENDCAFVLGGDWDGEIVQQHPLPAYFRIAVARNAGAPNNCFPEQLIAEEQTYRLEKFCVGEKSEIVWFYVIGNEPTEFWLIRALTALCHFRRECKRELAAHE